MNQRVFSFTGFGLDYSSPEQVSGGERTGGREHSDTRVAVLVLVVLAAAIREWRRYRTKRALMALSAQQRTDCGVDRPDIPTTCDIEATARRRLASGMPADWC